MARGTQLQAIIGMVRAEAGQSTSVAAGVDNRPALIQKIQRTQELYVMAYDWPFLRDDFSVTLAANQRFYDLPSNTLVDSSVSYLDMERIELVAINYSGKPYPIDRGISFDEYAQYNSEATPPETGSPVRRWDIKRTSAGSEQVEVWPIPTDNTQTLSFRGLRRLRPLVADSDVADLDDVLIALTVASEILARAGAKDAGKVEGAAAARYKQLKAGSKGASRMITMSGSSAQGSGLGRTVIRIGSQTN